MTEREWLACSDFKPMRDFLMEQASDRKLRLFGCACCRGLWHLLPDGPGRRAVEKAEQFADGLLSDRARATALGLDSGEGMSAGSVPRHLLRWEQRLGGLDKDSHIC
jgi:hypothetical protein